MAKKTKKMAFGGLTGAIRSRQPSPQMAPPMALPMPVGNKLGFAQSAMNTMNANAAKYPEMMAKAGDTPGGIAPLPGAVNVTPNKLGFAQSAMNTMNANAAKYPEMAAPAGVGPGMAPLPGAVRIPAGGGVGPRMPMKKGGAVKTKKMASGGKTSQLAKANGIAVRGKSRGRIV